MSQKRCWRAAASAAERTSLASALSKPDHPTDEDDVDAAGPLLVNLQDLPHGAVLSVDRQGSSVLELQAVLDDPLACRLGGGDELLGADDEDHIRRAPGV